MTSLPVVAGGIKFAEKFFFVALRPPHPPFSGYWEFPGGKIEAGESPFVALIRELKEELGILVKTADPLLRFQHTYPNRIIDLHVWQVKTFTGKPHGREGQVIDWVTLEKLQQLEFPGANKKVVDFLQ